MSRQVRDESDAAAGAGRTAEQIDRAVAERMRVSRLDKGMTLQTLAGQVGLTLQQIGKYETSKNRVSAGHLYRIARVLGVPIEHFFEDARVQGESLSEETSFDMHKLVSDQSLRHLLLAWQRLDDQQRKILLKLMTWLTPTG